MTPNHNIGGPRSQAGRADAVRSASRGTRVRTGPRPAGDLLAHLGKKTIVGNTPEEMAQVLHSASPNHAAAFAFAAYERASWGNDEDWIAFWRDVVALLSSNGRAM